MRNDAIKQTFAGLVLVGIIAFPGSPLLAMTKPRVPAGDIMTGTGDPGFVAIGDPHLRSDSILIDSGVANPEGGSGSYDADGAVRVQGPAVDVGAFESDVVFEDGFE